jgi:hypothetical protein
MATYKKDVFKILKSFLVNDYVVEDFVNNDLYRDILIALCMNNIAWISSNDRVLLTNEGEKYLFEYLFSVENEKKSRKL